jgi:hypothetical protein
LITAPNRIDLALDGARLGTYRYDPGSTPGFTDLCAAGRSLLRAGEARLPGIAVLHGSVMGFPIGTGKEGCGEICVDTMLARRGALSCGFRQQCSWTGPDGRQILTEVRSVRAAPGPAQGAMLDLTIRLDTDVPDGVGLGITKMGLLRVAPASALTPAGGGQMRNGLGDYGPEEIHGRAAGWCACVGVIDGATVGMAFLDHPANPWHPTPWIAMDGILSPSPFAWRPHRIEPFEPLTVRYRILVHEGYVDAGWADERLSEFAAHIVL